jgi:hypothetical protein
MFTQNSAENQLIMKSISSLLAVKYTLGKFCVKQIMPMNSGWINLTETFNSIGFIHASELRL